MRKLRVSRKNETKIRTNWAKSWKEEKKSRKQRRIKVGKEGKVGNSGLKVGNCEEVG